MYIKRKPNDKLIIYKGLHFPYIAKSHSAFKNKVTIGIGGNIGDIKRRFEHLFFVFKKEKRVAIEATSLILKNPPFGYKHQDDFLNSIIVLKTDLTPSACLEYLLRIEKKFGRKRSFRDAPRTLDLDIIFYNNRIINTKKLQIPHPSWFKRESVVIPLASMHQ